MTQGTRLMNHKIGLPMLKTLLIKVKLQIYVNTCLMFNVTQKRMNYDGSLPKKGNGVLDCGAKIYTGNVQTGSYI